MSRQCGSAQGYVKQQNKESGCRTNRFSARCQHRTAGKHGLSASSAGTAGLTHMLKKDTGPGPHTDTEMSSKWIRDLTQKSPTTELSEEHAGVTLP